MPTPEGAFLAPPVCHDHKSGHLDVGITADAAYPEQRAVATVLCNASLWRLTQGSKPDGKDAQRLRIREPGAEGGRTTGQQSLPLIDLDFICAVAQLQPGHAQQADK